MAGSQAIRTATIVFRRVDPCWFGIVAARFERDHDFVGHRACFEYAVLFV